MIADEVALAEAGQAEVCGHSCEHHSGGAVCIRPEHPDEEGNRVPHVGRNADGTLTQWTGCTPELDEEIRQQVETARLQAEAEQQAAAEAKRAERQELITDLLAAIGAHKERTGKLPWD